MHPTQSLEKYRTSFSSPNSCPVSRWVHTLFFLLLSLFLFFFIILGTCYIAEVLGKFKLPLLQVFGHIVQYLRPVEARFLLPTRLGLHCALHCIADVLPANQEREIDRSKMKNVYFQTHRSFYIIFS